VSFATVGNFLFFFAIPLERSCSTSRDASVAFNSSMNCLD
jgi:hypothetical protein